MNLLKNILRPFLDGVVASILFNVVGGLIVGYLPSLPFGLSGALVFGVLVLIVDYILETVLRL